MARQDFISDNLVSIRSRLQQSARRDEPAAAESAAPEATPATPATPVDAPAAVTPESAPAAGRRDADAQRARRDLAGRLAHDLAAAETEVAADELRLRQSRRRAEQLLQLRDELDRCTPESRGGSFPRAVDELRLGYFRLLGARSGQHRDAGNDPGGSGGPARRDLLLAAAIPAAAILIAALAVAAAIALVFR